MSKEQLDPTDYIRRFWTPRTGTMHLICSYNKTAPRRSPWGLTDFDVPLLGIHSRFLSSGLMGCDISRCCTRGLRSFRRWNTCVLDGCSPCTPGSTQGYEKEARMPRPSRAWIRNPESWSIPRTTTDGMTSSDSSPGFTCLHLSL